MALSCTTHNTKRTKELEAALLDVKNKFQIFNQYHTIGNELASMARVIFFGRDILPKDVFNRMFMQ